MSCILHIETSTNVCSVAVSEGGLCIFKREDHSGPNHAERLGAFADEAMAYISSDTFTYKAKDNGKVRLEGKEYLMQDGDVCYFRFNV